jgi:hypothetical protein
MKMKRAIASMIILAVGVLFAGCTLFTQDVGTLTLNVPESGYPPFEATLTAGGVINGQYTFEVEGKTVTQPQNVLKVTIYNLPCEVTVTWENGGIPQAVTETIWLKNTGPVIRRPVLNAITNLWTIHPRSKYTVTFPDAHDPEGGDVTLVNATVFHTGQGMEQSVFCPPHTGLNPPKIDLYRVRTGAGDLFNAFIFFSTWKGPTQASIYDYAKWKDNRQYVIGDLVQYNNYGYMCKKDTIGAPSTRIPGTHQGYWTLLGPVVVGSNLPYSPPDQGVSGYPGGSGCGLTWPKQFIPSGMTVITATFEDEKGATTTESWSIPTMVYPGC